MTIESNMYVGSEDWTIFGFTWIRDATNPSTFGLRTSAPNIGSSATAFVVYDTGHAGNNGGYYVEQGGLLYYRIYWDISGIFYENSMLGTYFKFIHTPCYFKGVNQISETLFFYRDYTQNNVFYHQIGPIIPEMDGGSVYNFINIKIELCSTHS
ncbi:MAG: hypothetical protein INQ03_16625 [Candidatus Heimdallarchaeota archaeon]|nr:hypothetical protein [Candidatus Heimdallarchaeota archaeon]